MFKKISLKFKSKNKDKPTRPGGPPGAAVPYDPDVDRQKKQSSIERWTPEVRTSNGTQYAGVNGAAGSPEEGRKLTDAASKGDVPTLRQLLKEGLDVNARDVV